MVATVAAMVSIGLVVDKTGHLRSLTRAADSLDDQEVEPDAPGSLPAPADRPPSPTTPTTTASAGAYGVPVLLGTSGDASLDESSGLVASRANPGLLWTHNDSGGDPLLHCLDRQARSCGTWEVSGAIAHDWEDLAAGPGPQPGQPYLYVGDIGDNTRSRSSVTVYRVPEPVVAIGTGGVGEQATAATEALTLRYPDGPRDAEALLVHPGNGDLYVVTKEVSGPAGVYRAPATLTPGATTALERIASLELPGAPGSLTAPVTGGDIAPDGHRLALSTYVAGVELVLDHGTTARFDDIWEQPLRPVALPLRRQGEAIAYRLDGAALLVTSEGAPMPLHEVALQG